MGCSGSKEEVPKGKPLSLASSKENEFKVVLIGDKSVGKTSIAVRLKSGTFDDGYELTIGGAYIKKTIQLPESDPVNMHIWDTGGEERYRAMVPLYYRDAQAALLVFDITDSATHKSLDYWINELHSKVNEEGMLIFIIGNKSDMEEGRQVSKNQALADAENTNFSYFETSAKTGEGVVEMFNELARKLHEKKSNKQK